jgi:hypothetical protein
MSRGSFVAVRAAAWICAAGLLLLAMPVLALDEKAHEKENLKACEQRVCEIILKKDAKGEDLKCELGKTWSKAKIKDGIEKKKISWGFGDARCGIDLSLVRGAMVDVLTKPEATLEVPKHTVKCEVERESEVTPISVSLAPKITFKDGKAHKAWLNISDIDAPAVVKGAIWTVAKVEDTFGLFHGEMIEEINEFVHQKCGQRYPEHAGGK